MQKGVAFKTFDVTEDREALKEMLRVTNGARSVPVITACGEVLIGFNAQRLDQMLECMKNRSDLPEDQDDS